MKTKAKHFNNFFKSPRASLEYVHMRGEWNELQPVWDFISVENLTSVFSALYWCSHELRQNETQNGMDFISVILTEMEF